MVGQLIISWDDRELRYLVTEGGAGAFPLVWVESTDADSERSVDWRGTFAELHRRLAGEKVTATTLLLGRGQVEAIYTELPKATDAELPLLVRLQVLRESPNTSDADPIDFISFDDASGEHRRVLAVTVPLARVRQWTVACGKNGFAVRQICYRPELIAAAQIAAAQIATDNENTAAMTLVVARSGVEIDLGGIVGGRLVALHTVRIPETTDDNQRIVAEIRRTVLVGLESSPRPITQIALCGSEEAWSDVREQLASLELPIITVPAPVLPADGAVDLLHPKEPPRPVNIPRIIVLAVAALFVTGGLLFWLNHWQLATLQAKHDTLQEKYTATATAIGQIAPIYQVLSRTDAWEKSNLAWLDELRDIAICLPERSELIITRMTCAANTPSLRARHVGTVTLTGMVRDPSALRTIQAKLQATRHHFMPTPTPTVNPAGGGYPWLFTATIYCYQVTDKSVYLNALPTQSTQ